MNGWKGTIVEGARDAQERAVASCRHAQSVRDDCRLRDARRMERRIESEHGAALERDRPASRTG